MAGGMSYLLNLDGSWRELAVKAYNKEIHCYKGKNYKLLLASVNSCVGLYTQIPKSGGDDELCDPVHLTIENLQNDVIRLEKEKTTLTQQTRDLIDTWSAEVTGLKQDVLCLATVLRRTLG